MKTLLLLSTLMLAVPATASTSYHCVARGQTSYQSTPCASGSASRIWAAPPGAVTQPAVQASKPSQQTVQPKSGQGPATRPRLRQASHGAHVGTARDQGACDRVRTSRDAAYARIGLRRTFAQSRQWDERVATACK